MKLRVHELQDAGTLDTTIELPADQVPLDTPDRPTMEGPVRVHIHSEATEGEILLGADVQADVRLQCSRCLEGFVSPLQARFDLTVSPRDMFVDVQEEARQSLLLALPVKPPCRPDCFGLCPRCGKDLNKKLCACPQEEKETPFSKLKNLFK